MIPKALILEDNPDLTQVLGKVLFSMGFEAAITHHIAEARRLIRDKSPELMLIDINLPDGNGLDLMAELQHDTRDRFIVISGNTSQQAMIKSIRSQAADVVVKPMDSDLMPQLEQNFDSGYISLVGNTFWEVEKRLMKATLRSVGGNKQNTGRILGISLMTLYNRLNAYK